jgi:hypothetical protein
MRALRVVAWAALVSPIFRPAWPLDVAAWVWGESAVCEKLSSAALAIST